MEQVFYVNGRPLIPPPPTDAEVLEERIRNNNYNLKDILKLDEKPNLQIVLFHILSKIDTEGLNENMISKHPAYQQLLNEIMNWNEKVLQFRMGDIQLERPLVNQGLYTQLRNQLQEVQNIRNRQRQGDFLKNVSQWFRNQLPKSELALLNQDNNFGVLQFNPQHYPEHMYKSSVQDYSEHYRSKHMEFDPPEERVKQYQRKNLISDASTRPGTVPQFLQGTSRPQTSQTTYKMKDSFHTNGRPKTNISLSASKPPPSWVPDQRFPVFETFEEQAKSSRRAVFRETSPLKADKPIEQIDEQMRESYPESQMGESQLEIEGGDEEQEAEAVQEPGEAASPTKSIKKKKKKIDASKYTTIAPEFKNYLSDQQTENAYKPPINNLGEYQSTYLFHDPTDTSDKVAIARLQQIYIKNRHKEVQEKKEDDEMVKQIQQWANNKGRINEMIVHKGYLASMGSKFNNVGIKMSELFRQPSMNDLEEEAYQNYLNKQTHSRSRMVQSAIQTIDNKVLPTQVEEEVEDFQEKQAFLEQKINVQNLQKLKKTKGAWLPGGTVSEPVDEYLVNQRKMTSSSCFRSSVSTVRHFSGIFKNNSMKQVKAQQVGEINEIKSRLASANKFVSAQTLQKSLVIPNGHREPMKYHLPTPGLFLAQDPEFGKKRRTKKKKK